jgi:hypothetical protein
LESLFGLAKCHGTGEVLDANRIALRLPALTGTLTMIDAQRVLKITTAKQKEIELSLPSLTKQRRLVLKNPEALENMIISVNQGNLEFTPPSKNASKTTQIVNISGCYNKGDGPISSQIKTPKNEDYGLKSG